MRVLIAHNRYRQRGGEDVSFEAEKALLQEAGHEVIEFVRDNSEIERMTVLEASLDAVWSRRSKDALRQMIQDARPDLVHFHNTFLLISPSAYYACRAMGVPIVQTLRNYRLVCPGALLMRDGRRCEDCLRKPIPWPGVLHGCWRNSKAETAVVATMLSVHRWLRTWDRQVDIYIALTEFGRKKFVDGGLPAEKIVVKPNFVHPDPGPGRREGDYGLFVGRLAPEKGIGTLLRAWEMLDGTALKIVGDGPSMQAVQRTKLEQNLDEVTLLGWVPRRDVLRLMQDAKFLVFPSEWFEGLPQTILEAFACGLPVIASRLGAMAEIVEDGRTGLLFEAGNPLDLAEKVQWAASHPREMREMGREARREYEQKYTAERNYTMLMAIYRRAIQGRVG